MDLGQRSIEAEFTCLAHDHLPTKDFIVQVNRDRFKSQIYFNNWQPIPHNVDPPIRPIVSQTDISSKETRVAGKKKGIRYLIKPQCRL